MIGLILTICTATSPPCATIDWRTCLRTKECHIEFVPVALDHIPDPKQCFMQGSMMLAKPGGWQDKNPTKLIKRMQCGEEVDFKKHSEQDA